MAIESIKWVLIAAGIWFGIYKIATGIGLITLF
jgi:hypothetical protein